MKLCETTYGFYSGELKQISLPAGAWFVWAPKMRGIECDGICLYNPSNSIQYLRTFYFLGVLEENPKEHFERILKNMGLWVDGMRFNKVEKSLNNKFPWTTCVAICGADDDDDVMVTWKPGSRWGEDGEWS